jgi:hypothetical protein
MSMSSDADWESSREIGWAALTIDRTGLILSQRHSMKPASEMASRFVASASAYILLFATPFCPMNNLAQKLVVGSLSAIIAVLMVGVLIRRSGFLANGLAVVLLLPAAWFLSLFVYELSPVGSDRSKVEARELFTDSVSVFKLNAPQREARRLLRRSSSLRYYGCGRYLDGGSMGFIFSNQETKAFVVFVPNPGWPQGIILQNGRQFQRIQIVANAEFSDEEPVELRIGSRAEAKVIRLVRSSLKQNLAADRQEEVFLLLEILGTRTFDWAGFQAACLDSPLPRAKGRIGY